MFFYCEECQKDYKTKYKIKRHLLEFHKYQKENVDAIITPTYQVKCHLCDHRCLSRSALIDHLNAGHSYEIVIEKEVFDTLEGNCTIERTTKST